MKTQDLADSLYSQIQNESDFFVLAKEFSLLSPKKSGKIDSKNVKKLKLKWAFGFPYSQRARSQPLFAMGSIFVATL